MTNTSPKNTFGQNQAHFKISDEYLDFQQLLIGVHLAEARQHLSTEIEIKVTDPERFNVKLDDIMLFYETMTDRVIKIKFSQRTKTGIQTRFPGDATFDFVSLYSGGLDSSSFPLLQQNRTKCGLLNHTITSNRMQGVARTVYQNCIPHNHAKVETDLGLERTVDIPLLHVRGVTFLTNLLCMAAEYDIKRVIIPENGPFMINYPVSMLVSPTRTTDPYMISEWTRIFEEISGKKFQIEMPFSELTKSEVILASKEPKLIQYTWSCSTSQGISKMCGICMACFVRILSLYAINEGENLNKCYEFNVLESSETKLKIRRKEKVRILINCLEFWKHLIHPDLSPISLEKTDYRNLTKRHQVLMKHSLDMFVGLKKYLDNNEGKSTLAQLARNDLTIIDKDVIENRVSSLERKIKNYKSG